MLCYAMLFYHPVQELSPAEYNGHCICSGIVPRDAYILTPSKCWFNPSVAEIMAYHYFSLSSLKVTQRPVFGGKSVQFIHQSTLDGGEGLYVRQSSGDESKDANEESFPTNPVSDVVDSDLMHPNVSIRAERLLP